MNFPESNLSAPATAWLESRGLTVTAEVNYYGYRIDLIGRKDDTIEAVSLKVSASGIVLDQAWIAANFANRSWACVQTSPGKKAIELCEERKLGLLSCTSGRVEVVVDAPENPLCKLYRPKRFMDVLAKMARGGVAGLPNVAGEGAVQKLLAAIEKYRVLRPRADWKELWREIPNSYRVASDMKKALRLLEKKKQWTAKKMEGVR